MSRGDVRPFAPAQFCFSDEHVKCMVEARLGHSGEYMLHLPKGGDAQWVVMNYQYIPQPQQFAGEYKLSGTNPKAYGLIDHFEIAPTVHHEGNSVKPERGSCFEIRGLMYGVKCVEIMHRCNLRIELCQLGKCDEPRPGFFDEVDILQCVESTTCVDTC